MTSNWDRLKWSVEEWVEKERPMSGNTYNSGKLIAYKKVLDTMKEFDRSNSEKGGTMLVDVRNLG
jgi:hypothetical protein